MPQIPPGYFFRLGNTKADNGFNFWGAVETGRRLADGDLAPATFLHDSIAETLDPTAGRAVGPGKAPPEWSSAGLPGPILNVSHPWYPLDRQALKLAASNPLYQKTVTDYVAQSTRHPPIRRATDRAQPGFQAARQVQDQDPAVQVRVLWPAALLVVFETHHTTFSGHGKGYKG